MAKARKKAPRLPGACDDEFQRVRHARYFEDNVVYHVVFRVIQGLFLLRPDAQGELRQVMAGILGQARRTFAGVLNHATVILSNHGHLIFSGNAADLAAYVGFIKRELSRRWGPRIQWSGLFEPGYHATAVLTAAGQRRCLKYVIGQTVKEHLVERPEQWPGFHCATALATGRPIKGYWLDGTAFGRARQRAKRKKTPTPVRREDFINESNASFDPLPALAHLSADAYRAEMAGIVEEVISEARKTRRGRAALGVRAVLSADLMTRSELPKPPWFEERRRMIVWDDGRAPQVRAYRDRYWTFQRDFRAAADRWREGEVDVVFPSGAFRPGLSQPVPHLDRLAA